MTDEVLTAKKALEYLGIEKKEFENYFKNSKEINAFKQGSRWVFNKSELDRWLKLKNDRIVILSLSEYEKCFEFAIKMAYASNKSRGTGIRGARSEPQKADDFIFGILAEYGVQKFLKEKFGIETELDIEVHPDYITEQDLIGIIANGQTRKTNINIAIKSSKWKSCFNVVDPLEYDNANRKSDVYIFVRVGLPSDHLFRILREHSFFKKVKDFLDKEPSYRKIKELKEIPIWITGFSFHGEFAKVKEIPGQEFRDWRYISSVADMHNSDDEWKELIKKF
ncbi:MAG: helix-turn-helix domain-containing protein [Nanoarchaeota archaeon]|nr:helix-turn-helix domain-containing protein [Nanoarchaeota archaeon]